jgi:hypothetical protein
MSCSAIAIARRRCASGRLNPLVTSAGTPGADLCKPETPTTSVAACPRASPCLRRPAIVDVYPAPQLRPPQALGEQHISPSDLQR